jgi:hypothetical protein
MVSTGPYSEILKERMKESGNLDGQHCMLSPKKGRSSTRGFIMEFKSLLYTIVNNDKHRGLTVAHIKTSNLCFEHIKINVKNLNFFFH